MRIEEILQTNNFKDERHKMVVNIKYTSGWINQIYAKKMGEHGISLQQFNVLRILRGTKSPLKVQEVRDRMLEKSPNITRLMDKMESNKLIKRYPCKDDRRAIMVDIKSRGTDLLSSLDKEFPEMNSFYKNITEEDAKLVNEILDRLRDESI